jgi:hypothetical protein
MHSNFLTPTLGTEEIGLEGSSETFMNFTRLHGVICQNTFFSNPRLSGLIRRNILSEIPVSSVWNPLPSLSMQIYEKKLTENGEYLRQKTSLP